MTVEPSRRRNALRGVLGALATAPPKQWAIGDWLVDGKQHYGDGLYKRAAEITGLDEGQLRNFKSMADCFQLSQRCDKLRWTHHREVASIKLIATAKDGKQHYGDGLYKRAAEITGHAEQTLRLHASMAGQFELLTRINNLSYQHHRQLAKHRLILPP